jgi:hypothetical protein
MFGMTPAGLFGVGHFNGSGFQASSSCKITAIHGHLKAR